MNCKNILEIMNTKDIIIPNYLIKYYKKLNLNYEELIFISYLLSFDKEIPFDINKFAIATNIDTMAIMQIISSLTEKKLIELPILKTKEGKMKEYIDLKIIKNKVLSLIIEEEPKKEINNSNIYSVIEKEFGRTLSPIEYETIKGWLDQNIGEEMIKEALKEAILNGVTNLKYIDKILFEWKRKGIKKAQRKVDKKEEVVTIPDYNWWDEDE